MSSWLKGYRGYQIHGKKLFIGEIASHLPPGIDASCHPQAAKFVVDRLMGLLGYQFTYHQAGTTTYNPQQWPDFMALSPYFVYRCSQRVRKFSSAATVPTAKKRNRTGMERHDCQGKFKVYFPDRVKLPLELEDAVIAVEYTHTPHPAREALGVPAILREWIKSNSRGATPHQVWDRLMSAIEKGEEFDPELNISFISQSNVLYWYRKAQIQRNVCLTNDPWVNLEAMLKENPQVLLLWNTYAYYRRLLLTTKCPAST